MTIGLENSRVVIMETPLLAPGTCVICGVAGPTEDDRKFIDIGLCLEFFGQVYFCTECITPVALAAGYVNSAELETIQTLSAEFSDELNKLKEENRIITDALGSLLSNRGIDSDEFFTRLYSAQELSKLTGTKPRTSEAEPESNEHGSGKRSNRAKSTKSDSEDGEVDFT